MKNALCLSIFLISTITFSQSSLIVVDSSTKLPIEDVKAYSDQNELVAISNRSGLFSVKNFPLVLKHWEYDFKKVKEHTDTVFLNASYQQIAEVSAAPFDVQKFYDKLVKKSNKAILKDESNMLKGIYFESTLEIDLATRDSVLLIKKCDLTLLKEKSKKKINYSVYPSNGKVSYREFGESKINLERISNQVAFIPVFSKMMNYDLSTPKMFKIKTESFNARRDNGKVNSLLLSKQHEGMLKTKSDVEYRINHVDDKITLWQLKVDLTSPMDSITKKFGMAIKEMDMVIDFQLDSAKYEVKSIVFKRTIVMKNYDGSLKEYHIVRAFVANEDLESNKNQEVKKIASYLESLEPKEDGNLIELYQF
ncbi:MAG: hypothetical protein COA33_006335 [Fluviicola sp.]|nr:hypothetical protein [Fluviicola sp.]